MCVCNTHIIPIQGSRHTMKALLLINESEMSTFLVV